MISLMAGLSLGQVRLPDLSQQGIGRNAQDSAQTISLGRGRLCLPVLKQGHLALGELAMKSQHSLAPAPGLSLGFKDSHDRWKYTNTLDLWYTCNSVIQFRLIL